MYTNFSPQKCKNVDDDVFGLISKLDSLIDVQIQNSLKQEKIANFFQLLSEKYIFM